MSGIEFNPKRGMIADFDLNPTKGSETGKTRPCIVVTNDIYNARLTVIQVVPLTEWSVKKSRIVTNITLTKNKQNNEPVAGFIPWVNLSGSLNLYGLSEI